MKRIVAIILICFLAIQAHSQAGRIRISFVGFNCFRETWDDILHMDGKGDEVFFTFGFSVADRNGNTKSNYDYRTGYYGDATGPFSNRTSAGTCVDMFGQNKGGIRAGDNYRTNIVIGEYDIADGDIVMIQPTAWEYDPIADNSNAFVGTVKNMFVNLNQKLGPYMAAFHFLTGNIAGLVNQTTSMGLSKVIRAGGDQGELGKPGTRPIGMEKYGDFTPKFINVNTPNLAAITSSNFGFGNGVIAVNYNEEEVGNARDHGNYSILIKIEFTPRPTAPAPAPAPSGTRTGNTQNTNVIQAPDAITRDNVRAINTNMPSRNISIPTTPITDAIAAGLWTGTIQTDGITGSQPLNLRLNPPSFWLLTNDGKMSAIAAGVYSTRNNIMSGYYFLNNTQINYTSTNYDAATKTMSGTWEGGGQKGTWSVKKIAA